MRGIDRLIAEVNDAITEHKAARDELRESTVDLVAAMITEGRTKEWGDGYIELICSQVDEHTAKWAKRFFEEEWARQTATPE